MDLFRETIGLVSDPRASNARYRLSDILFISVVAVLCGVTSCTGFAAFARLRRDFLCQFMELPATLPSHDVFSDLLAALDQKKLAEALARFMDGVCQEGVCQEGGCQAGGERQLAVDGKALRRAYQKGQAHLPAFVATLYDCDRFLTLALAQARGKGGETAAVIEALRLVSLKGAIVTADALHAKQATTALIRAKKGDYCIALKANSPIAFALARTMLATQEAQDDKVAQEAQEAQEANDDKDDKDDKVACQPFEQKQTAHGRVEIRQARNLQAMVIPCQTPRNKRGQETLVGMQAIGVMRRLRQTDTGSAKPFQTSFYALSFVPTKERFAELARNHWRIENNQHWCLDVTFKEDLARNRKGHAAVNLAIVRRIAQNILNLSPAKETTPLKMLRAAHDKTFLTALITQKR
jgi:predicted transposase YbfD/YdcC